MRLVGVTKLSRVRGVNSGLDDWISALVGELRHRTWNCQEELLDQFQKSGTEKENEIQFVYREWPTTIRAKVDFLRGIVLITEVFNGVHDK